MTTVESPRASAELLEAARNLVPMLRERADEVDRLRRIPDDVFEAMKNTGLFQAHKPKKYGGFELTPYEHTMICVELARGCASASWVFSLINSHSVMVLSYPEEAQEEVWGADNSMLTAGSVFPDARRAKAERIQGGFRLSGEFPFTSGSDFAEWVKLAAFVDGGPSSCLFLVPKAEVSVLDDWFTLGMRGTGSRTMVAKDVFVPEHRAIIRDVGESEKKPELLALHPTFDMFHSSSTFAGCFLVSAPIVGAALGAVEFFAESARDMSRYSGRSRSRSAIASSAAVQLQFTESAAEAEMARTILEVESKEVAEYNKAREPVPVPLLRRLSRDSAYAAILGKRSVERLFSAVGSRATFDGHPLNRAMRDISTAITQQGNNWLNAGTAYAGYALRLDGALNEDTSTDA